MLRNGPLSLSNTHIMAGVLFQHIQKSSTVLKVYSCRGSSFQSLTPMPLSRSFFLSSHIAHSFCSLCCTTRRSTGRSKAFFIESGCLRLTFAKASFRDRGNSSRLYQRQDVASARTPAQQRTFPSASLAILYFAM